MKDDASGLQEFDGAVHSSRLFQDGYCSHVNASCDYSSLESVHSSSSQSSASSDVASVSTMSRIVPPATNPGAWSQHSQAGLTCPASWPFSPSSFLACPALWPCPPCPAPAHWLNSSPLLNSLDCDIAHGEACLAEAIAKRKQVFLGDKQYRFGGPEHANAVRVAEDFVFSARGRLNELRRQQAAHSRRLTKLQPEMLQPTEAAKTPGERQVKGTSSPLLGSIGGPVRRVKFAKQPAERSVRIP
jgi:hypothetical protein